MEKILEINGKFLTLYNYKEPLKEIPKGEGFGFYGALLVEKDTGMVQCHICGEVFNDLGKHIDQKHKIRNHDYKEKFGLAFNTALISEPEREKRKQTFLNWLKTLTEEEKKVWRERQRQRLIEARKKRTKTQPELQLETKNKRGTCPDQLLDKVKEVAEKLGRTPSKAEFIWECESERYVHLIYKTFGSWSNALRMLKMEPRKRSDYDGKHGPRGYTDEMLLEYLTQFAQENNKVPTATDFRRGLLPDYKNYTKHFGTIENARQLARVYDFVDDPELRTGYKAKYHEAS